MFVLVLKNIRAFIGKKTHVFIFFISTLIVVSFAGIFLLNYIASELVDDYEIRTEYMMSFREGVDIELITEAFEKHSVKPSLVYYFNDVAVRYINTELSIADNSGYYHVYLKDKAVSVTEIGVYAEELNSSYSKTSPQMFYGRDLNSSDSGEFNARISLELEAFTENSVIEVGGVEYAVVGCASYGNRGVGNILVSKETFAESGNKVSKIVCFFEIPPFEKNMKAFISELKDYSSENTEKAVHYFDSAVILHIVADGGLYIAILAVAIIGVSGIFTCWLRAGNRNYCIYKLCGMSNSQKKTAVLLEVFIYIVCSFVVGMGLFYLLLNSGYKDPVFYPPLELVVANFVMIFGISVLVVFFNGLADKEKSVSESF